MPFLRVRWVVVLAEGTADQYAKAGAHVFPQGPVDRDIGAELLDQFASNSSENLLPEDGYGAVVGFQSVVEGLFVVCESELLASIVCLAHVFRQSNQLFDYLGGLNVSVLVAAQGAFQHLGEGSDSHDVLSSPSSTLALEELLQHVHREVAMGHPFHFGQELVGEDRSVLLY